MEDLVDLHLTPRGWGAIDFHAPKPDPTKIHFYLPRRTYMALIKSVDTDFGIPATYWNIGAVQEDFKGKGTEVTFYGYASKEAREAGKQPLSAGKVQIAGDEYVAGADRAALYAIIKQKPEFEGAEDA
jgi:hypothetical protein